MNKNMKSSTQEFLADIREVATHGRIGYRDLVGSSEHSMKIKSPDKDHGGAIRKRGAKRAGKCSRPLWGRREGHSDDVSLQEFLGHSKLTKLEKLVAEAKEDIARLKGEVSPSEPLASPDSLEGLQSHFSRR